MIINLCMLCLAIFGANTNDVSRAIAMYLLKAWPLHNSLLHAYPDSAFRGCRVDGNVAMP